MSAVRLLLIFALALPVFALTGCGGSITPSELPYLDGALEINGLPDDVTSVTVADLITLKSENQKVEATRSNGDIVKVTAVGPTLDTFLAQYGKKQTDFSSVRFYSTDGYSIAVPTEMLESRKVILAYMDGGKAFDKETRPVRVVIPGERAMYWAKMVNRIDFEEGGEGSYTERIVFLDTVLPDMKGEYSEEEGGDIVSTEALTEIYGGASDKIVMYASDGLTKNETADNFLKGYLKYTGENIPQFCSPDLPEGMNLNGIVSIRTDNILYYSLARALDILPERQSGDEQMTGIGLTDIVKGNSLAMAQTYELTDLAGEKTSIFEHDMVDGVFTQDDGIWTFYIDESIRVKNVVMLEAVK
ncbi:MAG: molybdopterin-dependent oxidoreductase [Clostridiales Family XIII bacterium]|jgi:hypothetical protein|nr:molybdopterin-dependent oxidoreductase [Clostridiales Family XIII bacterium]